MKTTTQLFGIVILTFGALFHVQAQSWLTNGLGLIAYYPFNGNANDASGYGNNPTSITATLSTNRFGMSLSAYDCGPSKFISYANALQFTFGPQTSLGVFGVFAWIKFNNNVPGFVGIVSKMFNDANQTTGFQLGIVNNSLQAEIGRPPAVIFQGTTVLNDGRWHAVGLVLERTSSTARLFVDGNLDGTITDFNLLQDLSCTNFLLFGVERNQTGFFPGSIDDVRIYNRALSTSEVQQLYEYESGPQAPYTNGLVAYYPFNGNANDASGNGNDGTLVGNDRKFLADRFGYINSSLWLNMTSAPAWNLNGAYVAVSRAASLDFNNDFTLSVWVNFSSSVTIQLPEYFVSNGNGNFFNFANHINYPQYPGQDLFGSVLLNPVRDSWWQTTVVRSGTNVTLFKNGSVLTNEVATVALNNPMIWLGRFQEVPSGNGSSYPLVGGIDDVRFYNRALSDSEVQQLYEYEVPVSQAPFTNGLVAYYPFNGNANDASGTGNNGIVQNATPAVDRFGRANACFQFNNSWVFVPYSPTLYPTNQTISIWFKNTGVYSDTALMRAGNVFDDNFRGYGISTADTNATFGAWDGNGSSWSNATYLTMPVHQWPLNTWVQLVFTHEGNIAVLYLNGQMLASITNTTTYQPVLFSPLYIGSAEAPGKNGSDTQPTDVPGEFWNGFIDEIRIYNRALSAYEVQQLYAYETIAPPCIPHSATATATIVNGFVVGASVTDGGCGYTNPPPVLIQGGGGTGATATTVINNGVVVGITITDAGIGYTNPPTIYIYSTLDYQLYTLRFNTATFTDWTVTAGGATNATPYGAGGGGISVTRSGFGRDPFLPGGSLGMFDGFWVATLTFYLPPNATGIKLSFSGLFADDRVVLTLNGTIVGAYGLTTVDCRGVIGEMVFTDGGTPQTFSFVGPGMSRSGNVTSGFNVGGANTIEAIINNTKTGVCGPNVYISDVDSTFFGVSGSITYYAAAYSPLALQMGLMKAVRPTFSDLLIGTNYQLQVSADLNTWTNQGAFTATNTSMIYPQYWDVDNWGQLFFQLQLAP